MSDRMEVHFVPPHHLLQAGSSLLIKGRETMPRWARIAGWTALFLATLKLLQGVFDPFLTLSHFLVGLVVAGVFVLVSKIYSDRIMQHFSTLERQGTATNQHTTYQFDGTGIRSVAQDIKMEMTRNAIDEILTAAEFSGLRLGARVLIIPDDALPETMTADVFRDQLIRWKSA